MRIILSIIFPLLCFGQMSITNNAYTTEINAPGRGAQYWNGTAWDGVNAPLVGGSTTGYTGYVRLEWKNCESSQGVYTLTGSYPSLEFWIRLFIDRGESFAFGGVMTVCDGCANISYDGGKSLYPQYLHSLMQAESVKDWKTSAGYWIPNWNSPSYLARFQALNDTISRFINNGSYTPSSGPNAGKMVRYRDVLDFVDVRGYGNFGEWHNYPYYSETPIAARATAQSFVNIVNVTIKSFPNSQLVAVASAFTSSGEQLPELGYHILDTSNNYGKIGWRRDNIGGPGDDAYLKNNPTVYNGMRFDTAILNRWKYAMITGEPLNGSGTCCPLYYDIRREIGLYHYAGFGNGNYGGNSSAVWDTIRNAFMLTGYRYQLSGSIDSVLYNNSKFNITVNWINIGAAPLYQKRWRVRYNIVNSAGVRVQSFVSKADLYLLVKGAYEESFNLSNHPQGLYKINLIVEDTTGYFISLPLNINTINSDGSYTIASVNIKNGSALSFKDSIYLYPINLRKEIRVYPNPVFNILNIELARNTSKPVNINIYDVTGRMLMQKLSYSDAFTLNLSELKTGLYIFKLYNRFNIIQKVEKLMKWK